MFFTPSLAKFVPISYYTGNDNNTRVEKTTMTYTFVRTIAQYDCGAYGANTYNNGQVCAATTINGGLANTGLDVMVPLGTGLVIIVAAVVLLARALRTRKQKQADS